MAGKLECHAGDVILLRAEVIGIGSDGPYVRVELGSGGATCFWASVAAITQIESGLEAEKGTVWLSGASSIA